MSTSFRTPRRSRPRRRQVLASALAVVLLAAGLAACSSGGDDPLVIYSGRTKELIDPLLQDFAEETGIDIEVRYGDSADLALAVDAEGDRGRADVFISQSPGAIGFLSANDRLARLGDDVLDAVPAEDRSAEGRWVGLSARARVLTYDPDEVAEADLPTSVFDLTGPEYRGRVAVAPTNGSFIDFVSGLRQISGDDAAREWLEGMAANESPNYANNNAILEAVGRGEVPMGLSNHYYLARALEEDPDLSARNHFFADGDPGSLLLVTAAGMTATSERRADAERFIRFLLSEDSQRYFAEETLEYPLAAGVEPAGDLPSLTDLPVTRIDLDRLGTELQSTLDMIRDSGIQR
jgi:iron(III) transport system substrate-binding protein